MNQAVPTLPRLNVNATDRLGLTLFFAAALHAMVILGISFNLEERNQTENPLTFEVTLVHSKSEQAPDKADYLAQANQQGGGTVQENVRPSSPFPKRRPIPDERGSAPQEVPLTSAPAQQTPPSTQLLTTEQTSRLQSSLQETPSEPELPQDVTAAELMLRSHEIARLSAEIREKQQIYAKMPREKVITANTKEYQYAAYEEGWRLKVERIGNLSYPEEARKRRLSGNLLLAVTIKADGTLQKVQVRRSSGEKILDDAAVRIVRKAAPYAPFPEDIRAKQDLLTIIRTWQFDSDSHLSSR